MRQITEDYVSYEIAKLLKEKGFDESVNRFYEISTGKPSLVRSEYCRNSFTIDFAAPTHQMALKWLREVHNVLIHVNEYGYPDKEKGRQYTFVANIRNMKSHTDITQFLNDSYEEAIEAALKYALENLI